MNNKNGKKKKLKKPDANGRGLFLWLLIILAVFYLFSRQTPNVFEKPSSEMVYGKFYEVLKDNKTSEKIKSLSLTEDILSGVMSDGARFTVNIPAGDPELIKTIRDNVKDFTVKPPKVFWANVLSYLMYTLFFVGIFWLFFYRPGGAGGGGGRIWSFGKSRATLMNKDTNKITFNDVAGVEEAKEELKEIIEFLRDPKKFQRLGGKIPKGVLLMGSPGTGKTLLAKAVAGEANVPFLSISGSDFVEMFVGVGASRVRDLFDQAKKMSKVSGRGAIIFIDEIDAVGRQRFAGIGGGHDEREQTLNAILVEMDGMNTQEGIILVAATNRPDVLDPALVRPGRFDRIIVVNRPDILGREAILKVHTRNIKLDPKADLKTIARQTPGFSGADLANLCNEAALLAARRDKDFVGIEELEMAIERVMMGPEKKTSVMSKKEKGLTAVHESGHALLSLLITEADPLKKVSVIPRGMAGGYTLTPPTEDRHYYTKNDLMARLIVTLGGRASEELMFNEISTGASNDLEEATKLARDMVMRFGMSDILGNLTFGKREEQIFLGRDFIEQRNYSDATALLIDQEIRKIIDLCYRRATDELSKNKDRLQKLSDRLLEKEVLEVEEIKKLLGFVVAENPPQNIG